MEIFTQQSNILVKEMEVELEGNGFDVLAYLSRCTLDVLCGKKLFFLHAFFHVVYYMIEFKLLSKETAMGVSSKVQTRKDSPYLNAVKT